MASMYVTVEQVGLIAGSLMTTPVGTEPAGALSSGASAESRPDARREADHDPLVARAKEYASGSLRVLQALRSRLTRSGDDASIDAAERLEETCLTVASKIHRAISSALESRDEPEDLQGDANGSAKVAILLIEESRQAWRQLMRPGLAVANGAPARFITTLDALESGLHDRFPRALDFVRPGFDTADDSPDGQIGRALLNSRVTTSN